MPKLADSFHCTKHSFVAAHLHLRSSPPQRPILWIVSWKTANVRVTLGVLFQLRLPCNCLCFWDYVAEDHATTFTDKVGKSLR